MNTLSITESAAKRISELISSSGNKEDMLRITVSAGGCSGFSYGFGLDGEKKQEDHIFESHGVKVIVDEISLDPGLAMKKSKKTKDKMKATARKQAVKAIKK